MQQKKMEEQMMYQQRMQQQQNMMMQRQQQQNMMQTNQANPYGQTISQQTANKNNMNQPMIQGLLFMGKVQQLVGFNWQGPVDGHITEDTFMNLKIASITKIKIKA